MQRALLLEERETLLPSKSPVSAASSYGTARLVASYSIVECMGGTGERWRFWADFCVKGQHFDQFFFYLGLMN